jgi:hypothetical protein
LHGLQVWQPYQDPSFVRRAINIGRDLHLTSPSWPMMHSVMPPGVNPT